MARTKKSSKKITVRKIVGRKVAKPGGKRALVRKTKTANKTSVIKSIQLKAVPAIMQTLYQLEKDISKRTKIQARSVKKLEAKLKKAELDQEKANKKLNTFKQNAEGKAVTASKLKPLQKAIDTARVTCVSIETQISQAKHILFSLHHELDIAKKTKEIIENFDKKAPNKGNVEKFPKSKNKKTEPTMQFDEVKLKNDDEAAEEVSEGNSEQSEE